MVNLLNIFGNVINIEVNELVKNYWMLIQTFFLYNRYVIDVENDISYSNINKHS